VLGGRQHRRWHQANALDASAGAASAGDAMTSWFLIALLAGNHLPLLERTFDTEEACQKARSALYEKYKGRLPIYTMCMPVQKP